jgi:hypothetical protein
LPAGLDVGAGENRGDVAADLNDETSTMGWLRNPQYAPRTPERRRPRNPRYAPESLERKLSPTGLYPAFPPAEYTMAYTGEVEEPGGPLPPADGGDEGMPGIDPAEPEPQPGDGTSPGIDPYIPVGPAGPA